MTRGGKGSPPGWARRLLAREPQRIAWALITGTVRVCLRHRIPGLAAEAAFFTLLSLPPLLLGMAGTIGYLANLINPGTLAGIQRAIVLLFHKYDLTEPSGRIDDLLAEVDRDRTGIFWG